MWPRAEAGEAVGEEGAAVGAVEEEAAAAVAEAEVVVVAHLAVGVEAVKAVRVVAEEAVVVEEAAVVEVAVGVEAAAMAVVVVAGCRRPRPVSPFPLLLLLPNPCLLYSFVFLSD